MQKVLHIVAKSRTLFIYCYIFAMTAVTVPFLHYYTGSITKVLLVWAALICCVDIVQRRDITKVFGGKILLAFIACSVITIIVNHRLNLIENLKNFAYSLVLLLIVFTDYYGKSRERCELDFEHYNRFFCMITCIASAISLVMFSLRYTVVFNQYRIGFYLGRLWGVYVSPNAGGITATISIILSLVSIFSLIHQNIKAKRTWQFFYWFNIIIEFVYISLTDSYGTFVSCIIGSAIVGFMVAKFILCRKYTFCFWKKYLLVFLYVLIFPFLCFSLLKGIAKVVSYLPSIVYVVQDRSETNKSESVIPSDITSNGNQEKEPLPESSSSKQAISQSSKPANESKPLRLWSEKTERQYEDDPGGSGRITLWRVGLRILKQKPVWGVGQANILDYAQQNSYGLNQNIVARTASGMHNIYLQVAVSNGLIGAILFLSFFAYGFVDFVRDIKKGKYSISIIDILLFGLIALMLANNMVEATVYMCQSGITVMFWLVLGYFVGIRKAGLIGNTL
ncbi:O-antigen ligase family protein [Bittarella massiliensis]|uniref:O-antigen ligase family protein n=1 Tax=Bittarella massiliensis (ex Durand et al. 2017) TaxID=1720313 RepID=UPI00163B934B|nr:O-antigen ligase family protein [Bittarella massiliensis (ex Durand et al. 2017)]MBC2871088.1 O-antigen ligase family protein [Bittarella massiliensis (ex Durand et al. 2017)]